MKFRHIAIAAGALLLGACDGSSDSSSMQMMKNEAGTAVSSQARGMAADTAEKAIDYAMELSSNAEKVRYLIGQGREFYQSENFQAAVDVAQYILMHLDKDSPAAKELLDNAKQRLTEMAGQMAEDKAQDAMGSLGL